MINDCLSTINPMNIWTVVFFTIVSLASKVQVDKHR